MLVNIQFSESKFNSIIQAFVQNAVLTSENLGLGGIRDIPFEPLNVSAPAEPGVIDHIEVNEISFDYPVGSGAPNVIVTINTPPLPGVGGSDPIPQTREFETRQLLALANISIHTIRVTDLVANGLSPAPAARFVTYDIQATFKVSQPSISPTRLSITFEPYGINFSLGGNYISYEDIDQADVQQLGADLLQLMIDNASDWFPPIHFRIDNLNAVFGTGFTVWNAGLRVRNGAVDLQLQINPSNLSSLFITIITNLWETLWTNYHSRAITNRLNGLDWGVYFPFELFERRIESTVETSLSGRDNVVLSASPSSTWNVSNVTTEIGCFPGEEGSVTTHIPVYLPGACIPWGYDMDVNLDLITNVSVPRPGVLRLDLVASHEVDPGDVFVCGSLSALLFSGAGVAIGGAFGGWIGAVIGGIIGGLTGGFTTLGIILDQDIPSLASSTLTPVPGLENAYFTEIPITPTENRVLGTIGITTLIPCNDGMVAGGSLTEPESNFVPLPTGSLSFPRWRGPRRGQCPEDGESPSIFAKIGFNFFRDPHAHAIPLVLWDSEVLEENPEGEWPDPQVHLSSDTLVYNYNFTRTELQLIRTNATDGIPTLKILIHTNAGARIFTVPIPEDAVLDSAYTTLENEIMEDCTANQDLIDSFEERTRNLRDMFHAPDGFFSGIDFDAIDWSLIFTGLNPAAKIGLDSIANDQISNLDTLGLNAAGYGRFDFWQADSSLKTPLQLRIANAGSNGIDEERGFSIGASIFRTIDVIELNGSFRDHAIVQNKNGVFAAVLTDVELTGYTLGTAGRMLVSHRQSIGNIIAVHSLAGNLYARSKDGTFSMTGDGEHWQEISEDRNLKMSHYNAKSGQRSRQETLEVSGPTVLKGSVAASASQKYALVLNETGNRLRLMELFDTRVRAFRTSAPTGANNPGCLSKFPFFSKRL